MKTKGKSKTKSKDKMNTKTKSKRKAFAHEFQGSNKKSTRVGRIAQQNVENLNENDNI